MPTRLDGERPGPNRSNMVHTGAQDVHCCVCVFDQIFRFKLQNQTAKKYLLKMFFFTYKTT